MHSAVAMSRGGSHWSGRELSLDDVNDLDELLDTATDGEPDTAGELLVVFVEEDDEWLGIVRYDPPEAGSEEARVFLSDQRVLATSDLASRLFADALPVLPPVEDEEEASRPAAEPVGDTELMADLGTAGDVLLELCAEEGLLPGDVVAALCERAGCAEELDEVRGT